MSGAVDTQNPVQPIPEFKQTLGHPRPLWMLFMTEFWERFAFYGIRWALVLYIVAQFHGGDPAGEKPAGNIYGAYLALVYAAAIFGGYVADRVLGYQRSILLGAVIMAAGLFAISIPDDQIFKFGLATIIVGNGLFKPNISTMVGKLYNVGDERRDSGFTIFYMGINAGALISPVLTGILAEHVFGTSQMPAYKYVFIASGIGMVFSLIWFWFGRSQLKGIGTPPAAKQGLGSLAYVFVGAVVAIPVVYYLLGGGFAEKVADLLIKVGTLTPTMENGVLNYEKTLSASTVLAWVLGIMFVALCLLLLVEGVREGKVQRDKVIAMLLIFVFNVLFWMFFEQAGSSFTFLADKIVDRDLFGAGGFVFPNAWFQSVNSLAIIALAPVIAWIWVKMKSANPSIPRKFGLGLIFNGLAFLLLMFALSSLVNDAGKIPFWTLFMVYVIQSVGELCLSPIGLSMVTKLAPVRLVGFGMGGWFLSTGIGNNLSGIFAGEVSGEGGMTTTSALAGYTFGFWALLGAGALLFLIAPLVQKLMHGVK
ncbi:peptide MFS transporter [Pseudoxanthomonas beigongshangi]